jgi:hypothetical protein
LMGTQKCIGRDGKTYFLSSITAKLNTKSYT